MFSIQACNLEDDPSVVTSENIHSGFTIFSSVKSPFSLIMVQARMARLLNAVSFAPRKYDSAFDI